jgi:hypothetical protein
MACLLLGLWLGAGAWMQWVAASNTNSANELLMRPSAAAAAYLKTLGRAPIGPLADYLAAQQNRVLFETWGTAQIVVSALFFFFLLFGTSQGKVPLAMALLLFLIAVAERVVIVPEMNMVALATDFAQNQSHRIRLESQALDYGYMTAELVKWVVAAGVAGLLIL